MEKLRYGEVQKNGVRPVIWTKPQLRFIRQSYEDGKSLRAIAQHFGFSSHSRITVVCREHGWTRTKKGSPSAVFRRFLLRNPDWCLKVYSRPNYSANMAAKRIAEDAGVVFFGQLASILNTWLKEIDARKPINEVYTSVLKKDSQRKRSERLLHALLDKKEFSSYYEYKNRVRKASIILFSRWDKVLPELRHRRYGLVVDHIFSIAEGYKRGVSLKLMCHPANMQTVSRRYNLNKGNKCDHSLKELKTKIRQFNMVHGDPFKIGDKRWLSLK